MRSGFFPLGSMLALWLWLASKASRFFFSVCDGSLICVGATPSVVGVSAAEVASKGACDAAATAGVWPRCSWLGVEGSHYLLHVL